MNSPLRRTFVVVGCAVALWGGSQAFGLAASEPAPPTPVSGVGKLSSALRTEENASRKLRATQTKQASISIRLDAEIASLSQEIATGKSMLSASKGAATVTSIPIVQTVTGASGGGDDGGSGDD